jgi:DNA topoisomerase-3
LVTLKEPQDYDPALKQWSLETLPFVPERFGLKPLDAKGARKQLAVVRRLFRTADELIAATDAGREGELIFRCIAELTGCAGKPARRLWLNSLTREAIRAAFDRLRPLSDYDAPYAAARCRNEADWVVGLNATRYYTVRYRTGGLLWSVGVQTLPRGHADYSCGCTVKPTTSFQPTPRLERRTASRIGLRWTVSHLAPIPCA